MTIIYCKKVIKRRIGPYTISRALPTDLHTCLSASTIALQLALKFGIVCFSLCFVAFKIAIAVWGLLCFHIHFNIGFARSEKSVVGILIEITLNLYIAFGGMNILLFILIHENGIFFSIFSASLFISLVFCNLHCRDSSHPWLNLFQIFCSCCE